MSRSIASRSIFETETSIDKVLAAVIVGGTTSAAIQAAIDNNPAGTMIVFPPQIYTGTTTISVPKAHHFVGRPGAIVRNHIQFSSTEATKLFYVTASDVTFEALCIDGTGAPAIDPSFLIDQMHPCYAIFAEGQVGSHIRGLRVRDCTFQNLTRRGIPYFGQLNHFDGTPGSASFASDYAVRTAYCNNIRIEDNDVIHLSGCAFFLEKGKHAWITKNDVEMMPFGSGDVLYHVNVDDTFDNLEIIDNHLHGGRRASGGAINLMSQNASATSGGAVLKRAIIENNTIEGTPGFGSGQAVLRMLSIEHGVARGNTIRAIPDGDEIYILVDARTATDQVDQPGPICNIITENILEAGATRQTGISLRHTVTQPGGIRVPNTGWKSSIIDNRMLTNGTHWFCRGIQATDHPFASINDNLIEYKYDAAKPGWGIDVGATSIGVAVDGMSAVNNTVNAFNSANSRGIQVGGSGANTVNAPQILGNKIYNCASFAVRLEATVNNALCASNICSGVVGVPPISDVGTNNLLTGNRYDVTAPIAGTWTMNNATNTVTINTNEARPTDRVIVTITSNNTWDKPVKVLQGSGAFTIKTVDNLALSGGSMTGTWRIDH